jgi:hypothetical protein
MRNLWNQDGAYRDRRDQVGALPRRPVGSKHAHARQSAGKDAHDGAPAVL